MDEEGILMLDHSILRKGRARAHHTPAANFLGWNLDARNETE
jgi:hypothetical protein